MFNLSTYTDRCAESGKRVLENALYESLRRDQKYVAVEHILNNLAAQEAKLFISIIRDLSLDPFSVKALIEKRIENARYPSVDKNFRIAPETIDLLKNSMERARAQGRKTIEATDLFMVFAQDEKGVLVNILQSLGVGAETVFEVVSARVRAYEREREEPTRPTKPEPRIFLCYRRDDSAGHAGRLSDRLTAHFGADQLFVDIDIIEPGEDFIDVIEQAVGSCEVLIAVIGKTWLSITDALGRRRLDNPEDYVRVELATALERNIRVIPVLVQGTLMPYSQELPEVLTRLARRNAFELSDARWKYDVEQLIQAIERVIGSTKSA